AWSITAPSSFGTTRVSVGAGRLVPPPLASRQAPAEQRHPLPSRWAPATRPDLHHRANVRGVMFGGGLELENSAAATPVRVSSSRRRARISSRSASRRAALIPPSSAVGRRTRSLG